MMMTLIVAVLAFATLAGLGFVFAGGGGGRGGKSIKRLQTVAGTAKAHERTRARTAVDSQVGRRKQLLQTLKANEKQQRKVKLTLESRLRQAGLGITVRTFWIISGGLGAVAMIGAFVFGVNPLVCLGIGFGAGFGLPRWVVGVMIGMRIKKFTEEFPNATDVIVRGIKSGLPLHDCLRLIGSESPEPLGLEFRRLTESLSLGQGLDAALEKMYERMPTSEVRFFTIVLTIQQKTGGNLAEALGNLSAVLRARKLMSEKIKAMSGEAVASAFIIGSLPPGVMVLIGTTTPAYLTPLFSDPRGHMMLLVSAIWMAAGIWVMRRMINFKF